MTSIVALVPARAGSKRIPGKNTKLLAGHPLLAYTIAAARRSDVFSDLWVCTDSQDIGDVAMRYTHQVWGRESSADDEPDVRWVERWIHDFGGGVDAFCLLRPTSPFRTAGMIQRAVEFFLPDPGEGWVAFGQELWQTREYDSLRAVEPVRQHPGKMWRFDGHGRMTPLLLQPTGTPWHSSPTQTLPKVYVQNASMEIAWTDTVRRTGTIAGDRVLAFETQGYEGFDLNTMDDWYLAELLIEGGLAKLPEIG